MHAHKLKVSLPGGLHAAVRLVVVLGMAGAGPALAQIKKCENLRDEIQSRLPWPKGSYRLEIVPKEERTEGKFLGQCEAGTKRIVAIRSAGAAEAQAAAVEAATVTVRPPPAARAAPAPDPAPAPTSTAPVTAAPAAPEPSPVAAAPAPAQVQATPTATPQVASADAKVQSEAPVAPTEKAAEDKRIQIKLPERIEPGESATLVIELDIGDAVRQLRKQLAEKGEVFANEVALAEKVEARVGGSKLKVGPEDRETQAVRPGFPAQWNFFLSPEDVGKQKVNIALTVELAKGSPPYKLYTETRDLVVERSTWDEVMLFVNKNLQWLAATVLVPLAGLWWKSRKPAAA